MNLKKCKSRNKSVYNVTKKDFDLILQITHQAEYLTTKFVKENITNNVNKKN